MHVLFLVFSGQSWCFSFAFSSFLLELFKVCFQAKTSLIGVLITKIIKHCHFVIALSQEYMGMVEVPNGPLFPTHSLFLWCNSDSPSPQYSASLSQPAQPPQSVDFLVCKCRPLASGFWSTALFLGTQSLKTSSTQSLRNEWQFNQ